MSFSEIKGQEAAIGILQSTLRQGRLAHAYLFHGIEGVGKRKTALALAKTINCTGPEAGAACCTCGSCLRIDSGTHPDILRIGRSGSFIRIDQIRNLQKELIFRPFEGRYRVAVIDEGNFLNKESSNCLLKTLEEPPEQSIIILIVTDVEELLPTIVSRCLIVPFRPLSPSVISRCLLERESRISEEEAELLGFLSGGSMETAIRLSEPENMNARKELCRRLSQISRRHLDTAMALAEDLAEKKDDLSDMTTMLKTFIRDVIALKKGLAEKCLINKDLKDMITRCADEWRAEDLFKSWDLLTRAEHGLSRNFNRQLILENAFLALAK